MVTAEGYIKSERIWLYKFKKHPIKYNILLNMICILMQKALWGETGFIWHFGPMTIFFGIQIFSSCIAHKIF